MAEPPRCQQCDAPLTRLAVSGLCANCLLKLGLEPPANQTATAGEVAVDSAGEAAAPGESAGSRIGRYRLLQQIGEGGFGLVWMAEQLEPVTRRVALKIVKMGMDTREVIARFEAERQALAMMDHPNIARVLDAGATESGRPFFVMELVKGISITKFCDEQECSTRQRLELFEEVCSAVNHAHQKGVIHRDIKPSNVMVTLHGDKPVPKVIDFGIAKATQGRLTDRTVFTHFEQFVGTPAYMSPEQTAHSGLDIDTRSDIYALGILLYELLTGKPPFDTKSLVSAGYEEMRRIIREVEPPKPSSRLGSVAGVERTTLARARRIAPEKLSRLIEPDLDWIVMKAIEKDRNRRYETANGLAMDIERFLSDATVSATPPGVGYRLRKFARRNKTALRVATAIAMVLMAATGVTTSQMMRAVRAEKEAADRKNAEVISTLRRRDAEDISNFFLNEMFRSLNPALDGRPVSVREMLTRADASLDSNFAEEPERKAMLQGVLGRNYHSVGLYREAIPLLKKSRDHFLAARGREHPDTLAAMHDLANSLHAGGRYAQALALRQEVLEVRRTLLGPEHPDTIRAMSSVVRSLYTDRQEALTMQNEVVRLSRKVLGPGDPDTIREMHELALARFWAKGFSDEELKEQLDLLKISIDAPGQKHPDTLSMMHDVAHFLDDAGRFDEALELRLKEVSLRREVNPSHSDTLHSAADLARSYHDAGRGDKALPMQQGVLEDYNRLLGPDHPDTLFEAGSLAYFYVWAGCRDDALPLLGELIGAPDRSTLLSLKLTALLAWLGREEDRIEVCRQAFLQAAVSRAPSAAERAAKGFCLLPSADTGMLGDALSLARRAVELGRTGSQPQWFDLALGMAEYRNGNYPAADRALTAAETAGPKKQHILQTSKFYRAMSVFRQGGIPEARKVFADAAAQMKPLPVEGQPFKDRADHDDLIVWLAYKEAKALLQRKSTGNW
jgi:eukaryotic-like serine/threonine-protein kinase